MKRGGGGEGTQKYGQVSENACERNLSATSEGFLSNTMLCRSTGLWLNSRGGGGGGSVSKSKG